MNKKAILGRNSILLSQLPIGLRKNANNNPFSGLNNSSNIVVENESFILGICGEDFSIDTAVARKKTDGKIYKASNIIEDDLEVIGIANSTGIADNEIKIKYEGEHYSDSANFSPGKPIYLCAGSLNYSTDEPDMSFGKLYQKLGYSIDDKSWIIDIENAMEMY